MSKPKPEIRGGCLYDDTDRIKHFRASKRDAEYDGLTGNQRIVEVRYDHDSDPNDGDQRTIDEICAVGLHLEGMTGDSVWMDVLGVHVWFRAVRVKGTRDLRILVTCYPNEATPYVVKPGEGILQRLYEQPTPREDATDE